MHKCVNNSDANVSHLEQFVSNFFPYSQKQLGFDKPVTIKFESDNDNAAVLLGKTAYYDPQNYEIALYIDGRHPKDIMRSLSHELVHHAQNCRGDFGRCDAAGWELGSANGNAVCVKDTDVGYAQRDPHLRKMEREAYTKGNLIFRDFEDLIKTGKIEVHIDFTISGEPKMSLQEWKNNEINTKLMKKWGLLKEGREITEPEELEEVWDDGGPGDEMAAAQTPLPLEQAVMNKELRKNFKIPSAGWATYEKILRDKGPRGLRAAISGGGSSTREFAPRKGLQRDRLEEDQAIFAPNHYCVHHGGVQHEGKIKMAEAVNHNFNRKLNRVTHYDMKLEDGTILEAVAAEDIQVVNASLAEVEDHTHSHDIYGGGDDEGGCPSEEGGESTDISELSPEEAFAAGMAAAKEAIESAMGGGGPPEGGGPLEEDELEESTYYRKDERGKKREESISRKISVREAKELTHRVIERIKMENK